MIEGPTFITVKLMPTVRILWTSFLIHKILIRTVPRLHLSSFKMSEEKKLKIEANTIGMIFLEPL